MLGQRVAVLATRRRALRPLSRRAARDRDGRGPPGHPLRGRRPRADARGDGAPRARRAALAPEEQPASRRARRCPTAACASSSATAPATLRRTLEFDAGAALAPLRRARRGGRPSCSTRTTATTATSAAAASPTRSRWSCPRRRAAPRSSFQWVELNPALDGELFRLPQRSGARRSAMATKRLLIAAPLVADRVPAPVLALGAELRAPDARQPRARHEVRRGQHRRRPLPEPGALGRQRRQPRSRPLVFDTLLDLDENLALRAEGRRALGGDGARLLVVRPEVRLPDGAPASAGLRADRGDLGSDARGRALPPRRAASAGGSSGRAARLRAWSPCGPERSRSSSASVPRPRAALAPCSRRLPRGLRGWRAP